MLNTSSPFVGDKPDSRLSFYMYAENGEIKVWNDASNPIFLKTLNNSGLSKFLENESYMFYKCKESNDTNYECCLGINKKTGELLFALDEFGLIGRMTLVTEATTETHSFVAKGYDFTGCRPNSVLFAQSDKQGETVAGGNRIEMNATSITYNDFIVSKSYNTINTRILDQEGVKKGMLNIANSGYSTKRFTNSLFKLLIYKNDERGGMTQEEMENELKKNILLK
ncbi:MAG: hypothetical protein ACRC51_04010 [Cetobacterium sp.]